MITVCMNRTPDEFWRMTPRETFCLIREYGKQEALKLKNSAKMIGFSSAMYNHGQEPFKDDEVKTKVKVVVDNDNAFLML